MAAIKKIAAEVTRRMMKDEEYLLTWMLARTKEAMARIMAKIPKFLVQKT